MVWKNRNMGLLLAGIWLVCTGLVPTLGIHVNNFPAIMALLAIAAGVFMIMGR